VCEQLSEVTLECSRDLQSPQVKHPNQ